MKVLFGALALIASVVTAHAQYGGYGTSSSGLYGTGSNPNNHYVSPYTTRDGTHVPSHHQTNPNNTQLDNYGTRGNVNPYTGTLGTRAPRY